MQIHIISAVNCSLYFTLPVVPVVKAAVTFVVVVVVAAAIVVCIVRTVTKVRERDGTVIREEEKKTRTEIYLRYHDVDTTEISLEL